MAVRSSPARSGCRCCRRGAQALDPADIFPNAPCDRLAPATDADELNVFYSLILFRDFMGDAHKRPGQRRLVHYLCFQFHALPPFRQQKCPADIRQDTQKYRHIPMYPYIISDFAGISVPKLKNLLFVRIILYRTEKSKPIFSVRTLLYFCTKHRLCFRVLFTSLPPNNADWQCGVRVLRSRRKKPPAFGREALMVYHSRLCSSSLLKTWAMLP